jgi:hypothetical protein
MDRANSTVALMRTMMEREGGDGDADDDLIEVHAAIPHY